MDRMVGRVFFFYLVGLVVYFSVITVLKGALFIGQHEGDTLHLADIIMRMAQGEWPHLDFVTPLGIAAFLPIVLLVKAGFGIGMAILLAQILFAVVLIPMIWWVSVSRLPRGVAFAFGAVVIITVVALIHGEADSNVSISMHYNRWAWALAFLAIPVAVLAPEARTSELADGLILGLAMAFFILGKVTFGVAFAPGLLVALAMRKAWKTALIGVGVLVVCLAIPTLLAGIGFWKSYVGDLLQVAGSGIRPKAGVEWQTLLIAPRFLVGNIILVASIILLRKGSRPDIGLVLLVLAPGFIYVTYQNFGNDPKWLALLALLLVVIPGSATQRALALAAAVTIAPSFINMTISPVRHLVAKTAKYEPALAVAPYNDLMTRTQRVNQIWNHSMRTFKMPEFALLNSIPDPNLSPDFQGEVFPSCEVTLGPLGMFREMAADLRRHGLGDDAQIFTADTFGAVWIFGGFAPLKGGAPWYYGDLSGFENAEYLLVPICPLTPRARKAILTDLNEMPDLKLKLERRTELYLLYKLV